MFKNHLKFVCLEPKESHSMFSDAMIIINIINVIKFTYYYGGILDPFGVEKVFFKLFPPLLFYNYCTRDS